jgi:hypothetical protein
MKLNILIIFVIKIFQLQSKFFKTVSQRTKMDNLACNISEKSEKVSEIEKSYIEFSNSFSESGDQISQTPKYLEFLEKLKKDKAISEEFLIIKMFYGDEIASRLYMDLVAFVDDKDKSINDELNEDEVLLRVKDLATTTHGFGAKNYAQYQAIQFLKEYKLRDNKYRCDISMEDQNDNSEREKKYRTAGGEKYLGWRTIKFYKNPKKPKLDSSPYWINENNRFPAVEEYFKNSLTHCEYGINNSLIYVDELSEINLYKNCEIQLIGDQTKDTEKREVVKLSIDATSFKVKFFVSEKILDYNCLGWALGLMDFLNPVIYTDPPRKVHTMKELKLYLKQFKEAMTTIRKWSENNAARNTTDPIFSKRSSILEKLKPGSSLINDLIENNLKIEGDDYLIGITDDITQAQITNVCKENLDDAVIFYGSDGYLTHAARYSPELNTWTSKMGYSWLLTHSLHLLDDTQTEKSVYGRPKFIYCPKGVNNDAEGAMPARNQF